MARRTLRVLSWNVHQATARSPAWAHLLDVAPDIALLQEVIALPDAVTAAYETRFEYATRKAGGPQRFGSAVLVRGRIERASPLSASEDWVTNELARFGGNVVACDVVIDGATLTAVCVHSPAWPVDRARLKGIALEGVKLQQNPDVWVADLLLAGLRALDLRQRPAVVAGDFNLCESFDKWRGGPRGNREYLDRMAALGLIECLRQAQGRLTPTYRKPGRQDIHAQIDHVFVNHVLAERLRSCTAGDPAVIFDKKLSDHLPVVADFAWSEP